MDRPSQGSLQWNDASVLWLFTAGVMSRAALFLLAYVAFDVSLTKFAELRDGDSYIAFAKAMIGDVGELIGNPFHQRVFPGYPALIALAHLTGFSLEVGAVLVNWVCVGSAAVLTARLFADRRLGWASVTLTPSYLCIPLLS